VVIDGSGADGMWFVPLLGQDALDLLELGLGGPLTAEALQETIGHDLAVNGITPKLFLPGLSGLTQGCGFPTCPARGAVRPGSRRRLRHRPGLVRATIKHGHRPIDQEKR
jgi:hypothetical protein